MAGANCPFVRDACKWIFYVMFLRFIKPGLLFFISIVSSLALLMSDFYHRKAIYRQLILILLITIVIFTVYQEISFLIALLRRAIFSIFIINLELHLLH